VSVLLLDTNLWSYLGEETDAGTLAATLSAAGHEAVITPQMLTEALRTSDVAKRTRIVDMMCARYWRKLWSAMDAQAAELTAEIRRLRPEWLRSIPKTDRLHSFRDYWTKVYWREAKTEPEVVIARIEAANVGDDAEVEIARVQAANKEMWPFLEGDLASAGMAATTAEDHPDPDPGSRLGWPPNTPVLLWRVYARDIWWAHMGRELGGWLTGYRDTTTQDSLGAYVDLQTMRRERESFNRFFLFEVEGWYMPRSWWQGTVEVLQLGKKLGTGNGADATHASYLPDCDYLLTTDKRFAEIVQTAADTLGAPKGGAAVLVKPHPNGWHAAVRQTLNSLPPRRNPSPTRVIASGITARIGDGSGEISAAEVRRNTKRGQRPSAAAGQARLVAEDGTVVADLVQVSITSDPALRPEGMKTDYFGAMKILDSDGANGPVVVHTKYVLEWLGPVQIPPTKIWVGEVEDDGVLASFAVNSKL
jgi:hypothetical protein